MTLKNKLVVSASPHDRSPRTVRSLMLDVIIALIPALIASVIFYGPRALLIECVSVATCVIFEYITRIVFKRSQSIGDLSAVITGLLLAFNLPVSIPLWMVVIGSLVAIVVVKQFFGGIGQNFVNPALAGRIVLLTSFPVAMSTWTQPLTWTMSKLDGITSASPLSSIHEMASGGAAPDVSLVEMLIGVPAVSAKHVPLLLSSVVSISLSVRLSHRQFRSHISARLPLSCSSQARAISASLHMSFSAADLCSVQSSWQRITQPHRLPPKARSSSA